MQPLNRYLPKKACNQRKKKKEEEEEEERKKEKKKEALKQMIPKSQSNVLNDSENMNFVAKNITQNVKRDNKESKFITNFGRNQTVIFCKQLFTQF